MNPIRKLLRVGDTVWSATGKEMTVTSIDDKGFKTSEDYFFFSEVRKLFWLTRSGYESSRTRR